MTDEQKRIDALEKANEELRNRISRLEGAQRVMDQRVLAALNKDVVQA